jgi:hypothetical protein
MTSAEADSGSWRAWFERGFERWGEFICRHKWSAALLCLVVTGWLVSLVPDITVDNSTESFLLPDDPAVIVYNEFRDQFGRDDRIVLAIDAPEIFSFEFLTRLRELHEAIEAEIPYVDEVDSLLNARVTRGEASRLVVEELLEDWPQTPADLERVREIVLSNPLYLNSLISVDGHTTAISIKPATYSSVGGSEDAFSGFGDEEPGVNGGPADGAPIYLSAAEGDALIDAMHELVARFDAPDFRLHLAGALVLTHRINAGMTRDLGIFLPTTLAIMCIVLAVLFRRIGGVVLPLLVVVLSLLATLGIMVALGIPGSAAVQILPVFLLTVGVCDAVHILAISYRLRMEGASKDEAIARALGHSGLAVLMTSLTTAVGMGSFATAEMAAVADLGTLAPIGVALAFVYTMVLLPALMAIFPMPRARMGSVSRGVFPLESVLVAAGRFAARHPFRILFPTSLLIVVAFLGALQTSFSHNGLEWFPERDPVRIDFEAVDRQLGGSISLDIVFDTREAGGVYEPALLAEIDRIGQEIGFLAVEPISIGSSLSLVDVVEETHQALNENRPEMRRIPDQREAVAQELLLFENSGSDDTEEWVDSEYRIARLSLRIPFSDALLFPPFVAQVENMVEERLAGRADFQLTGLMMLLARIFDSLIESMMRSYAFALLIITPLMMLLLGSLRRGLVSMIPNLMPVVAVLGVMGWLGLALDSSTILVGAMVIGIAVDDTIHFMHKFQHYFDESGNLESAVVETMRTTGSAMLFTSLVLAGGFAVFALGEMSNMRIFGLLSSFAAAVAFLADILVAPALLALVERTRKRPSNQPILARPVSAS